MIQQPISVGDVVDYHGSITEKHGRYVVTKIEVAPDYLHFSGLYGDGRGYVLDYIDPAMRDTDFPVMYRVRRQSITLISTSILEK